MATTLAKPTKRPKPPKLNARALAWIAEGADGRRDATRFLIRNADQKLELVSEDQVKDPDSVILVVSTPRTRKQPILKVAALKIQEDWDAVFLSESAVEKFLFPYYAAQRLLTGEELKDFMCKFYKDANVVGAVHKPPSQPLLLKLIDGEIKEDPIEVGTQLQFEIGNPAAPEHGPWWDEPT